MTRRAYAVIGHPIAHSLSPAMHRAAFDDAGLDATYDAIDVAPSALARFVGDVRAGRLDGLNVTVPHKEAVRELLDDLDDDARAIGAVNTVVREGARLRGANTDARGLVRALEEADVMLGGASVLVIGGGGAARAAAVGLAEAGASICVAARRLEQAASIAATRALALADLDALRRAISPADVVVQSTSASLSAEAGAELASRLPLAHARPSALVVDLVYRPRRTPVLRAAEAAGLRTLDGIGMLVHQGALAWSRWTGLAPPVDVMRRALASAST